MENTAIRTVSPNKAKTSIKHAMKKKRPIFLWGPPGIGKSEVVEQITNSLPNSHLIDIRLSLWEPTDIKGIPYFDSNSGTMVWGAPGELPSEEFAKQFDHIVLFLDEMNSAAPAVQAAAYQLILNRKVGTYKLPDNVSIVAATMNLWAVFTMLFAFIFMGQRLSTMQTLGVFMIISGVTLASLNWREIKNHNFKLSLGVKETVFGAFFFGVLKS